jgi:hypothetical protein
VLRVRVAKSNPNWGTFCAKAVYMKILSLCKLSGVYATPHTREDIFHHACSVSPARTKQALGLLLVRLVLSTHIRLLSSRAYVTPDTRDKIQARAVRALKVSIRR